MPPFKRGDVLTARVPTSHGALKIRPVLVIQNHRLKTGLPQILVAYITSVPRKGKSRVRVPKDSPQGRSMGLLFDSIILADVLATLSHGHIIKKIGACPVMEEVDAALRQVMAL